MSSLTGNLGWGRSGSNPEATMDLVTQPTRVREGAEGGSARQRRQGDGCLFRCSLRPA